MGEIVRTTTTEHKIAIVEITDDYEVRLTQGPKQGGMIFNYRSHERYTPDEAEQLAQELVEAASGIRVMRALEAKTAEKPTEHHAEASLITVGGPTYSKYGIQCPDCNHGWGLFNTLAAAEKAANEHNEQVVF